MFVFVAYFLEKSEKNGKMGLTRVVRCGNIIRRCSERAVKTELENGAADLEN